MHRAIIVGPQIRNVNPGRVEFLPAREFSSVLARKSQFISGSSRAVGY